MFLSDTGDDDLKPVVGHAELVNSSIARFFGIGEGALCALDHDREESERFVRMRSGTAESRLISKASTGES